jgi:hypothetical protein
MVNLIIYENFNKPLLEGRKDLIYTIELWCDDYDKKGEYDDYDFSDLSKGKKPQNLIYFKTNIQNILNTYNEYKKLIKRYKAGSLTRTNFRILVDGVEFNNIKDLERYIDVRKYNL